MIPNFGRLRGLFETESMAGTNTQSFTKKDAVYTSLLDGISTLQLRLRQSFQGLDVICDGKTLFLEREGNLVAKPAQAATVLEGHAVVWYNSGVLYATTGAEADVKSVATSYSIKDPIAIQLSGGEMWAVNTTTVLGLFSGLSQPLPPSFSVGGDAFISATPDELFIMDSATGDLIGLPHAVTADRALALFFMSFADNTHEAPMPLLMPPQPWLLKPRLAAQPLDAGRPLKLSALDSLCRSFIIDTGEIEYCSALPSIKCERAYSHWAPKLCEPLECDCPFYTYGGSCQFFRSQCERASFLTDSQTECNTTTATAPSCPTGFAESDECEDNQIGVFVNCILSCEPRASCPEPHVYVASDNFCRFVGEVESAVDYGETVASPSCFPTLPFPTTSPPVTTPTTPSPTVAPTPCEDGSYLGKFDPTCVGDSCVLGCIPCRLCTAGFYMETYCTDRNQTQCRPCKKGTYISDTYHSERECKKVTCFPNSSTIRNGDCINLQWLKEHWYIFLLFPFVGYIVYGVKRG